MQGGQNNSSTKKSQKKKNHHLRYSDFEFIRILGIGAYSKVQLVERKGIKYALKIIQKRLLEREDKQYQAFIQRQLLRKINHQGIVSLKTCFQDHQYLYFCLEYCQGGDFITFITNNKQKITDQLRVFYIAQIVSILEYLNKIKIIHRDLKPQNILLSKKGHIKLTDFGTAEVSECVLFDQKFRDILAQKKKQIQMKHSIRNNQENVIKQQIKQTEEQVEKTQSSEETEEINQQLSEKASTTEASTSIYKKRKATFVGTCFYVPPQLIQHEACSFATDLWALGCIMYQLYYEKPPFDGDGEYQIFEKIKNIDYNFPKNDKINQNAIDLIKNLLQKNPKQRLGSNSRFGLSFQNLKQHQYFQGINFQNLFQNDVPSLLLQQQQFNINDKQKQFNLKLQNKISNQIKKYLQNNINILINGTIQKRTFINYNMYYLIIFTNLKILRIKINEIDKIKQTQIQLNKKFDTKDNNPAQYINNNMFKLYTKQKIYKFKTIHSYQWVNTINSRFKFLKSLQMQDQSQQLSSKDIQKQFKSISEMLQNIHISVDS